MLRNRRATATAGLLVLALIATALPHLPPQARAAGVDPIRYTYDAAGRLTSVIDPVAGSAAYGLDAAGNNTTITRRAAAVVAILEVSPDSGAIGAAVAIQGSGFSATPSQNTVKFNGVTAVVTSATTTQVMATVPSGASTGTITVTAPAGNATSPTTFAVQGATAPTISGLSVTTALPGTSFVISGTNFSTTLASNLVRLNNTFATVTAATASSLTVTAPAGAGSGKVTVTTANGQATSSSDFFIPLVGYTASQIEYKSRAVFGTPTTVTVSGAGKKAMLTFDAVSGDRVTVAMGSGPLNGNLYLVDPMGFIHALMSWVPQTSASWGQKYVASGSFVDAISLPQTGTYSLFLDPFNTGSIPVTVSKLPADFAATGTIGGPATTLTISVPGQNATLTFTGTAGQEVSLQAAPGTFTGGLMSLAIKNPDGSFLFNPLTIGNGGTFIDRTALPATGTYTLTFDPAAMATGSMAVTIYEVPADFAASGTIGGPATTLTVSVPAQNATLTFTGTTGQKISLQAAPGTFTGGLISVAIKNPDGSYLVNPLTIDNGGTFIDRTTLPATGVYTLTFDPASATTGSMAITIHDVPADFAASGTIGGPATTLTISVPGQNANLTLTGTIGQKISVAIGPNTLTLSTLSIKNPDGSDLLTPFNVGAGGSYIDRTTLPATGTYTFGLDGWGSYTGSMAIIFYDVPADFAASGTIGGPATTLTISVPGQNANLTFSGTAGQKISVAIESNTITLSTLSIKNPDGSDLITPLSVGVGGSYIDRTTLPATGTYTFGIDGWGSYIGSMAVTLYDVPADFAATGTIGGPATTLTISVPGQNANLTFSGTIGQKISVAIGPSGFVLIDVSIKNPDGSYLVNPFAVGAGGGTIGITTMAQSGSYVLTVDGRGSTTGSTAITINDEGTGLVGPEREYVLAGRGLEPPSQVVAERSNAAPRPTRPEPVPPTADDSDTWVPGQANLKGDWRSHRPASSAERVKRLIAKPGVTALSGVVLDLGGKPLAGMTLAIGDLSTQTDAKGRFLLEDVPDGRQTLEIDGSTGSRPNRTYGTFEFAVAPTLGITTVLPGVIWLPRIDTQHSVTISSPTTGEVVVTSPYIEGLELHIPAGTIIEDEDGEAVTEISITPIPVDRTPFPLPDYVNIPVYFTIQPGGAYVEPKGAWLVYPNYSDLEPGSSHPFWHYDPHDKGWYIYGHGTVTPDGRQVTADRRTRLYEFTGAMFGGNDQNPAPNGPENDTPDDGDPVDLGTGLFVLSKTDASLPGLMPVNVTRTYRQLDTNPRPFGVGTNWNYGLFLSSPTPYQVADLNLPDGGQIHYVRTSSGNGFSDAIFETATTPGAFYKSFIKWNGVGWTLTLRDGTKYIFHNEIAPLSRIEDRYGNSVTLSRDIPGSKNITQATSSDGRWVKFTWVANRITAAVDNLGRSVGYTYDANGRLWKVTDQGGGVTEYTYDAGGRMWKIKDALFITFLTVDYYADGKVQKQTQADGSTFEFTYVIDGSGKITRTDVKDPRGFIRKVTFNASGQMLTDTAALGTASERTVSYVREAGTNHVLSTTDPLARRTDFDYDPAGNVTSVTRLAGTAQANTTTMSYDPVFGVLASVTDPLNHTTTNDVDPANGNIRKIADPRGKETVFTHNANGQVLTATDATSKTTSFEYAHGDLVAVINPANARSTRFTDPAGRVTAVVDPVGNRLTTAYDALNRPMTVTDPLGGLVQATYDGNANLLTIKDPKNNTTTFTYDNMDRVATRKDALLNIDTFAYDANGNMKQVTDRKGLVTWYDYDPLNRRTFAGFNKVGTAYDNTISYTFDAGDRHRTAVDSLSGTVTLDYDDLDRLTSETTPQGTTTYGYDAASRRERMTLVGQPDVTYGWDDANRPTSIVQGTAVVTPTFDDAGRLLTMTYPNGMVATSGYDAAGRLASLVYTIGATTIGGLTYGYDAADRRTTAGGSLGQVVLPAAVSTTTYNANNQLTKWASNSTKPTYDKNGNMLADGTYTYVWNTRNQLTQVKQGTTVLQSFTYDALGGRMTRTASGTTTGFAKGAGNVIAERVGGSVTATMLTGGTDQTFRRTDGGTERFLVTDALGSTLALVDAAGAIQTSYTYEPFGNTTVTGAASANRTRFTGREDDGQLYFYRARYMHPTFGRFISEDPAGMAAGDTNLYRYVGGAPTMASDPSGLILDTAVDAGFVAWDIYNLMTGSRKDFEENLAALGLDLLGMAIPFVTGLGAASRVARHADDALGLADNGLHYVDDVVDACRKSFAGDTPVATPSGDVAIDEIDVGDQVVAWDLAGRRAVERSVIAVSVHRDSAVTTLAIDGDTIRTTPDHLFLTVDGSWVNAGDLRPGDDLQQLDGGSGVVFAVTTVEHPRTMWDLTVADVHTFAVGDGGWVVHNDCWGQTPAGRPLTKHYSTEQGPIRNLPGSVVDHVIDNFPGVKIPDGKTVHYDPINNVTVVTGDGGAIVSAHKGRPRANQLP